MKESGRLKALLGLVRASKSNTGDHLKDYTLPMIIGMGSTDPDFSSPHAEAEFIHGAIRSAQKAVVMYPNVKHYPQIECPSEVAKNLLQANFYLSSTNCSVEDVPAFACTT
ncbi:hypothetical protein H257_10763 [Aphanomyces astaci]|uniref:Serine aminopeptidase S33 domain-containing protein n=1 Tax=Aphanomyces astaci TaxID=112090 RepID=W4G4N6_APHAT|nr:hypothetical protein H257_10763 [Aphanomyces astaci]ETV74630.1 hypothetical protein H257_10763 [Aphanomyces astaci]|eukprot:XP_009835717.1 hypothetical protein H257_10763 [Aphanomyces astaci]